MKITWLGTAAAEGMPAVFCNCEFCREARRLGGKNIRTRSQAMINDDLLIDFPADSYSHFLQNNIEGDKIKTLLITHSHSDHYYPTEFWMRNTYYAHDMRAPELKVYCSEGAYNEGCSINGRGLNVELEKLEPFQSITFDDYTVTALPARHAHGDGALFYIIQDGEKTLLYAHDTGYFYEEVFDFIREKGFRFDLASLDCTNVDIPINDEGSHMSIPNIERVLDRLTEMGAVDEKTIKVINHFSHNANPLHHILEERVKDKGWLVTYDGFSIKL